MRINALAESWPEVCAAGRDRLGSAADLQHSWRPWVDRYEIVDDDRRPAARLYIPVLLGRRDVVTAEVDRTERGVVAKRRRHNMRLVVGPGRSEPRQPLASEVLDM